MPKPVLLLLLIASCALTQETQDDYETYIASIFTTPDTSFLNQYERVTTPKPSDISAQDKCGEGKDKGLRMCVRYFNCDSNTGTIIASEDYDGTGSIDISVYSRAGISLCDHYLDVCCKVPQGGVPDGVAPPVTTPPSTGPVIPPGIFTTPPPEQTPPPLDENVPSLCGIRNENGIDFKITGNNDNEAEFGEFPWMVAILHKEPPKGDDPLAICGGSLIALNVVLTGAHCVYKYKTNEMKVRAGEWDTQTERERYAYQERGVQQIIVHESFTSNNLFNDVALLILDKPFKRALHIATMCLPPQGQVFNSKECLVSGWGKDVFGRQGRYQVILKNIQLPTVPKEQCQKALQETRLGLRFKLHESFICAGGETGKDACTGDGGSPLICPDPSNPKRYVQAGVVAWGIGCGSQNVPGVYVEVSRFRNWIDNQLSRLSIPSSSYVN